MLRLQVLVLRRERVDRRRDDQIRSRRRGPPRHRRGARTHRRRAGRRKGAGTPRPRARSSFGTSMPTWQRQTTGAPRSSSGVRARRSAGRGSITMSRGRTSSASSRGVALAASARRSPRSASPSAPPSPGAPWRRLWIRFVTAKNSGVARDHHPARVDPGAARVCEQRLEHLGHSPAAGGGVDVPHDAAREQLPRTPDRRLHLGEGLGADDLLEALGVQGHHRHLL